MNYSNKYLKAKSIFSIIFGLIVIYLCIFISFSFIFKNLTLTEFPFSPKVQNFKFLFIICISILVELLIFIPEKVLQNKKVLLIGYTVLFLYNLFILFWSKDTLFILELFVTMSLLFIPIGILILGIAKINTKFYNIFELIVILIILGSSIWLPILYVFGIIGFKVSLWIIFLIQFIFYIILYCLFRKSKDKIISIDNLKIFSIESFLFAFFLTILFTLFFIPTSGLLAAPLHDPAQNSITAKMLIEGDFLYSSIPRVSQHYPPGASYLTALIAFVGTLDPSKVTLYLTNIFNITSGITFSIFIKNISKKRYLGIFAFFIITFISGFVTKLYALAGKNSQILGYNLLLITATFFYIGVGEGILKKIVTGFLLISCFLIHYNNMPILTLVLIILFIIKSNNIFHGKKCKKK